MLSENALGECGEIHAPVHKIERNHNVKKLEKIQHREMITLPHTWGHTASVHKHSYRNVDLQIVVRRATDGHTEAR